MKTLKCGFKCFLFYLKGAASNPLYLYLNEAHVKRFGGKSHVMSRGNQTHSL